MNENEISKEEIKDLRILIDSAIFETVQSTKQKASSPQEPDYICELSTFFSKKLCTILKGKFPQLNFNVTGIYCHQKPLVEFECKKIELGDILFVYIDHYKNDNTLFNSLLFQAKLSSTYYKDLYNNELNQLKLYEEWPKFVYSRAGSLNGQERDITPKSITDGAQYLLIYNDCGHTCMGCAKPSRKLKTYSSLGDVISNFLIFKSGRQFYERNFTSDEWSNMIWDLLTITKGYYSKRKNIGEFDFPRNNLLEFYCSEPCNPNLLWNQIQDYDYREEHSGKKKGMSMVIIESFSKVDDKIGVRM